MNTQKRIWIGAAFALFAAVNLTAITGREIAENVENRSVGDTTHALVGLRLTDSNGQVSERVIEQYGLKTADGLIRNVIIFHRPPSVEGTRFLTIENADRDDDQWIYLPALQRVRRIAAGEGDSSFMGTDFTYDDLQSRDINDYSYSLLREETFDGRPTYVVEMRAVDPDDSSYSRSIQWVDAERWIPLKIELYDEENELLKINTVTRLEQVQGHWTIINNRMENVQTGHTTELFVQRFVYDEALPEGLFTRRYLETGRP